jgi:hypothetical protein
MSVTVSDVVGFIGVSGAVVTWILLYQSHFTLRARRLQVIDLATKRLEFWNEYLKAGEAAGEHRQDMKNRALDSISHAVEYADTELQRLSWVETQWRTIARERAKNPRKWRFVAPSSVRESDRRAWYISVYGSRLSWILCLVSLAIAALLIATLPPHFRSNVGGKIVASDTKGKVTSAVFFYAMGLYFIWAAVKMRFEAATLEYPSPTKPKPPILDKL